MPRSVLGIVAVVVLLSGCAYAGVALGWGWSATAALVALVLAGCGVPDVVTKSAAPFFSVPAVVPPEPISERTVDVSNLGGGDGSLGFIFRGDTLSRAGTSVSMGDFNGDGFDDVAIGAPHRIPGNYYGGAYIIFGGTAHGAVVSATTTLPVLARLYGQYPNDYAGTSVAFLGDVNGVAGDDLAIGSPRLSPNTGSVEIVFGTSSLTSINTLTQAFLTAAGGYLVGLYASSNNGEGVGTNIAFAGDMNGDGNNDFLIAAPRYTGGTGITMGKVYEGFISSGGFYSPSVVLSPPAFNKVSILKGPPPPAATVSLHLGGYALAGGGDVDGDGFPDVLIGAPSTDATYDHAFVHFNPRSTSGTAGSFPSIAFPHFGFRELYAGDCTGCAGTLGDLDGDGRSDLIVASSFSGNVTAYSYDEHYAGRVHIVFGSPALPGTSMVETQLDGTNGFSLIGAHRFEYLGVDVAVVGDVNGDGYKDLAIVAYAPDTVPAQPIVYIVFGTPRPGVSEVRLSQLTASQGLILTGFPISPLGAKVAGGRDVDGDGKPDLVIGLRHANGDDGAVYVVFNKALQQ